MSYILDALKKSEAERRQARSVSLLDRANDTPRVTSKFVTLLAIVLFINAIVLGIWFLRSNTEKMDSRSTPAISSSSSDTDRSVLPGKPSNSEAPLSDAASATYTLKPAESEQTEPEQHRHASQRISFDQLTPTQRSNFPALEISTHIYANDPDLRAIVANGKRVLEGEAINDSMTLVSITEEGIIVDYHGKQIIIPILQEWD